MCRNHSKDGKESEAKRTMREEDRGTQEESDDRGGDSHESSESWPEQFELLFGKVVLPDQYKDLSRAVKAPKSTLTPELPAFVDGAVISNIRAYPVMVATPDDIAGAVVAAVVPAVNDAVAPAVAAAVAPLTAMQNNVRLMRLNARAMMIIEVNLPLWALHKEIEGAGPGLPGAALPPMPLGHPFPVGTVIPTPPFPATRTDLGALSHADISGLSAVYNDHFGIVAGDGLQERRDKLTRWLTGV